MTKGLEKCPERLFVYECVGPRRPEGELEEPGFLGLWPEPPFYYFFFAHEASGLMTHWMRAQGGDWRLSGAYELDYDQWQQLGLGDKEIGPFVIRTGAHDNSASTLLKAADKKLMHLSPGLVFGSGLHATTQGCIKALVSWFEQSSAQTVVDLGTGTGILAIACGLLGASRVLAIDCNPLAVRVAARNIQSNGLQGKVQLLVADGLHVLKKTGDLLLMNLEWPCLRRILAMEHWLGYRTVVLSGFLKGQWPELKQAIPSTFRLIFHEVLDDWVTVMVSREEGKVVQEESPFRPLEASLCVGSGSPKPAPTR